MRTNNAAGTHRPHGDLADWKGLERLSDHFIVDIMMWSSLEYGQGKSDCAHPSATDLRRQDLTEFRSALLRETERRGWPDGWWEDPSIVLGLSDETRPEGPLLDAEQAGA